MTTTTGTEVFAKTLEKSNLWIDQVRDALDLIDRHDAYRALRAVLHALRDRLGVIEAAELGAQLPMLLRGLYFEGWRPSGKPLRIRSTEQFLDRVKRELVPGRLDPAAAVEAVITVMDKHISRGELEGVRRSLPQHLRELWPEPAI